MGGSVKQKSVGPRLLRLWEGAGILAAFFGLIPPVFYGIFHPGVAVMLLFALALWMKVLFLSPDRASRLPALRRWLKESKAAPILHRLLSLALGVGLTVEGLFSIVMIQAGWFHPPVQGQQATAVVLGCLTIGDQPSRMLRYRLEKALSYLEQQPEAMVVVTGGKGDRETCSEGEVSARWLEEHGISPDRILVENQSSNTRENLELTVPLLKQAGLGPQVVIVSDGFHQLRGQLYARRVGLEPTGLPSKTPWGLLPTYWLREQMGICKALLLE